jgi:hypothetical protein
MYTYLEVDIAALGAGLQVGDAVEGDLVEVLAGVHCMCAAASAALLCCSVALLLCSAALLCCPAALSTLLLCWRQPLEDPSASPGSTEKCGSR